LTIFKLHCGKLTLKIYTKGERVLGIEAVAHNTPELGCGRSLDKFPAVVSRLKAIRDRFADALTASISVLSLAKCSSSFRSPAASARLLSGASTSTTLECS
jgi:hypothetical protein